MPDGTLELEMDMARVVGRGKDQDQNYEKMNTKLSAERSGEWPQKQQSRTSVPLGLGFPEDCFFSEVNNAQS